MVWPTSSWLCAKDTRVPQPYNVLLYCRVLEHRFRATDMIALARVNTDPGASQTELTLPCLTLYVVVTLRSFVVGLIPRNELHYIWSQRRVCFIEIGSWHFHKVSDLIGVSSSCQNVHYIFYMLPTSTFPYICRRKTNRTCRDSRRDLSKSAHFLCDRPCINVSV